MRDASNETRAKIFSLKSGREKPGVTYAVCLIGRYLTLIELLERQFQIVGDSVPSLNTLISTLHNVLNQVRKI